MRRPTAWIAALVVLLVAGALAAGYLGTGWPVLPGGWPRPGAGGPTRAEVAFAWPEYTARLAVPAEGRAALARALARARPAAPGPGSATARPGPHFAYWVLDVTGPGRSRQRLWISPDGRFFAAGRGPLVGTEPLWEAVRPWLRRLEAAFFGAPLPWPEVDRLWPRDAVAVLRDLESGRRLQVARYGGYQHADAEPLTAADTAVLRSLYGGQWSWRRRAVVLEVAGRRVAASINGMPHGEGVVAGNGFPGHFCVHTLSSTTHVRDRVDPGHHLMVLKSSGRLVHRLRAAPPHVVATWLLVALANGDAATAAHMVSDPRDPGWPALSSRLTREL